MSSSSCPNVRNVEDERQSDKSMFVGWKRGVRESLSPKLLVVCQSLLLPQKSDFASGCRKKMAEYSICLTKCTVVCTSLVVKSGLACDNITNSTLASFTFCVCMSVKKQLNDIRSHCVCKSPSGAFLSSVESSAPHI